MISTQPVFSLKYFQLRKNKIPENINCLFYLSWEDALWDILIQKKVKKGSVILIPDFYCGDVEKNIKLHGYKIAYYKIKSNLKADKNSFLSSISKYKPEVVIIFHPVGIKSNLLDDPDWLAQAVRDSILIEDAVHRALDVKDFMIIKKNHFVMDSLRKVVPIQGSRLYGRIEDLDFEAPVLTQSFIYSLRVNFLWFLMTMAWSLNFQKIAEKLMIKSYRLIGDSILPARGHLTQKYFSDRLDISRIQKTKRQQAIYYEENLGGCLPVKLEISDKNKRHLRGYPVILPSARAGKILRYLRDRGLMVRFELDDSPWAKKQKIFYLPLGVYIGGKQLKEVAALVKSALSTNQ